MIINKVLRILSDILALFLIFIIPLSTFLIGLLVKVSFGILLIPITAIWGIIYFLLYGLSYMYKFTYLRPIIGLFGIPIAVIGDVFISLMPSMGEEDSKRLKRLALITFPYTYNVMNINKRSHKSYLVNNRQKLQTVLKVIHRKRNSNSYMSEYIDKYLNSNQINEQ